MYLFKRVTVIYLCIYLNGGLLLTYVFFKWRAVIYLCIYLNGGRLFTYVYI
jgi:hypothetical protein